MKQIRQFCHLFRRSALLTLSVAIAWSGLSARAEIINLTVEQAGQPLPAVGVYAFRADGSYLGSAKNTNSAGVAVFDLPLSSAVKFRLSRNGTTFWSDLITIAGAHRFILPVDTTVLLSRGGEVLGQYAVLIRNEGGDPFGNTQLTDGNGIARFTLPDGTPFRFYVDADGRQFFSPVYTAPVATTFALPRTTIVTLTKASALVAGRTLYAYSDAGTYLNYSRPTDATGIAQFALDEGVAVKFRVEDAGAWFFTSVLTTPSATTFNLPADTLLTVTRDGGPLAQTPVQVYDEYGTSLSYSRVTDANGVARFSLAGGRRVKFRVDAEGRMNFSSVETTPGAFNMAVPAPTRVTVTKAGVPQANRTIYACDEAGVPTDYLRMTDASGVAQFCFDPGRVVKFRVDDQDARYFSDILTAPAATTFALSADTTMTVTREGVPLAQTMVFVCDEAGAYTGYSRVTDANGVARFSLAGGGRVKFRVDAEGRMNFSSVETTPGAFNMAVPAPTRVTVTKAGVPQANRTIYACDEAGVPTDYLRMTDASGVAQFCFDPGRVVKFRVDDQDARYFSNILTAPAATTFALSADTTMTVTREGVPLAQTMVFVCDEAGAYTGYSRVTDANGVARFSLAGGRRVKFRVDAEGRMNFSSVETTPGAFNMAVPAPTRVAVTKAGVPQANRTIYACDEAGVPTDYLRMTDANGVAQFCFDPGRVVKFRVDDQGAQFFSNILTAPAATTFALPVDTTVTVTREGVLVAQTSVYVYDEAGVSTGYSRVTDANGVARFSLAGGRRVKFRVDAEGRMNFSAVETSPGAFSMAVPAPTRVTVTKAGVPQPNRMVYACNEAGVPTDYMRLTDANGVAQFCFDPGHVVKFRADDAGTRKFTNTITAPANVAFDLDAASKPTLTSAVLRPENFERGADFALEITGTAIESGSATIDFWKADGGTELTLPFMAVAGKWIAAGVTPATVPRAPDGATSVTIPVTVTLRGPTGMETTASLTFALRDDTNPPAIALDQPTIAQIDAPSASLTGTVSLDAVSLALVRSGAPSLPVTFDPTDGRFSIEVPLQEGLNNCSLVARDFLGNQSQVALALTRTLRPPVIAFTEPISFSDSVNTTTLRLAGTVTDASAVTLTINGTEVTLGAGGAFEWLLSLTSEGPNTLTVVAEDAFHQKTTETHTIYRITEAPALALTSPATDRLTTRVPSLQVTGAVGASATQLSVNAIAVADFANGVFAHPVVLTPGDNLLVVEVRDALGNTRTVRRTVVLDQTPPTITCSSHSTGFVTNQPGATVVGRVTGGQTLVVNGQLVTLASDGTFSTPVTLTEGTSSIVLEAQDAVGNVAVLRIQGTLDTIAPLVLIERPTPGATLAAANVEIAGTVDDLAAVLTLNTAPLANSSGAFLAAIPLANTETTLTVSARDVAGNVGTAAVTVRQDLTPPVVVFTAPANGSLTRAPSVRVTGTVDDPAATVVINGRSALVSQGRFELADFALSEGENVLTAIATDPLGNTSAPVSILVTRDSTAPAMPSLIDAPAYVRADRVTLRGNSDPGASIAITGGLATVTTTADAAGVFNATVLLVANRATDLIIRATDSSGNESAARVHTIVSDTLPPVITLTRPAVGANLSTAAVEVFGTVADANPPAMVTVNGLSYVLSPAGQFGCRLTLPDGAGQMITVTATDLAGNQAQRTTAVNINDVPGDEAAPVVLVLRPAYDAVVPTANIAATVLIVDESPLTSIVVGGSPVIDSDNDGLITADVSVDGNGEFTVVVTDAQALTTTVTHRVQVQGAVPETPTIQRVSPESPTAEGQVVLYASAQPGLRYEILGGLLAKQTGTVGADGKIVATIPLTKNATNSLRLSVIGANGLASTPATVEVVHDNVPPQVMATTPAAASEGAALNSPVRITFSEPVRSAELAGIEVRAGNAVVACTRSLSGDGREVTLTPSTAWEQSVLVQVTVPSTVADLVGNPLGAAYVYSFKTLDSAAPASPLVNPVPPRTNRLTLVLTGTAEPLSRIIVSGAAAALPTAVNADGTFSVAVTLHANTLNTLLVSASDAAGNSSAPVSISIAHDDRALTIVSSVPADAATNVALNTAIAVTFSSAIAPASVAGVTLVSPAAIPGTVAVQDNIVSFTPAAPLAAGKDYEIVVPGTVADLSGNRLGTTQRIGFSTTTGTAIAVPIVYTAQPTGATNRVSATITGYSNPGTKLLVSGGEADFEFPATGAIDSTGLFTLEVPLRRNATNTILLRARDAQGVISPSVTALEVRQDSTAPTVVSTIPANGAMNVEPNASFFVEFSEAVQPGPLTATVPAIRLFDAQNRVVAGSWILSADGRGATLYLTRVLTPKTSYSLLISTAIRDLAGNPLPSAVSVDFVTAASTELERPATPVLDPLASTKTTQPSITLSGSAPVGTQVRVFGGQSGATAAVDAAGRFTVSVDLVPNAVNPLAVVAVADGAMSAPATITITQVQHAPGIRVLSPQPNVEYNNRSVTVAGVIDDPDSIKSISVNGASAAIVGRYFFRQVVLDPAAGPKSVTAIATLQDDSTVEATVSFSLLVEPAGTDTKPPIPRFIFPEEGDSLNGEVVEALLTVEEGVQLTSVDIDRVVAHQVVGNIFFILARMPQQGPNTITARAEDAAGLIGTTSVHVTMDSIGFAAAPAVTPVPSLTPDRAVTLTGTAEPGSTIVVLNGLVPVRTIVSATGDYTILVPLNPNAANHLQVVTTDAAGNLSPVTTIDITHDDTAPTIVSSTPSNGQTGVPQNATIEVTFSEPLNATTTTADDAVVLRSALGQAIARNVLLSADGKTIRIIPTFKFLRSDTITVELDASIADEHGYPLGRDHTFSFTTAVGQTTVSGIVVDPQLRPLANVKVGIQGSNVAQVTSSFGTFLLDEVPLGDQILTVDARPDPATGVTPQGDARRFGYLEFVVPVRRDTDNGLGRPIFMVETDVSTSTPLATTGGEQVMTFTPAQKDLTGFSITYQAGAARFSDGTVRGSLTATRIDPANIPDRLPSGAIPHFLVEIGPDGLVFDTPARLGFPNVYGLAVGAEVVVFHFKYGVHNYAELGRAAVAADGLIHTGPMLTEAGFVGIVPASGSFDLTRAYLEGRVVDAAGTGLAGVSVNAIAGSSYVVTDAAGRYSIPLPDVRLELIRTFATVSTDLGARSGESPSLVFQSQLVTLNPSGVTKVPDIVVDSFFLGGSIRYVDADGGRIPATGLAYGDDGKLVSIAPETARGVDVFVYRRLSAEGALPEYDSEPYMRTLASVPLIDDHFDASFALTFLGSLQPTSTSTSTSTPSAGDVVKIVAFDRKTGFYGETDLKIPAAAEANSGNASLDVLVNLELRPPVVKLDMNRVFFLDGIRRRANIPHRGIAFTSDEYVEFKTTWTTPVASPLDRAELSLAGRLRVNSIDYQTDYGMPVRGGEHFRVLEIREAVFPNRLQVLQRDTDVGVETFSISRDGSFVDATLLPIEVMTSSYGLAQAEAEVAETSSKKVQLNILNLAMSESDGGLNLSGRTLPRSAVRIGGLTLTADGQGFFNGRLDGALGAGGLPVGVGDSLTTRFGEALAPIINALDATPPGLVPSRGAQGVAVVISGAHFSPVAADNKVDFNGAAAQVQSASETQLTVIVPELASSGDVTVTVAGKRSNGVRFDFVSVGINNGSFEDGTLRAWTLEGSGDVLEQWKRVTPTDRQYMAFLDTMANPRDGVTTLTSDPFEVPAGMQTLLFEYNFVATALFRPVSEVLELQIVTDSETVVVNDLFAGVELDISSPISGFDHGTGFRTAAVVVQPWAGTSQRIRLRLVLKGRGPLPEFIPGMNRYDQNPIGLDNNQGTGVFLDNLRLSTGYEPVPPPLEPTAVSIVSDGTAATITSLPAALPAQTRVFLREVFSGELHQVDVGEDGRLIFSRSFSEGETSADFFLYYATPPASDTGGRMFSPQIKLGVAR
ncbi:Ig-like domain-containing protein [Opitutus terrae]|uniref:Uncharacterized protein n=1 Tax=Opitutus terrae (strain DSM 11246 / JCM 15787 / PB90-1) TaxID=452637 RepID=B1ZZE3_OPITP|nr:Ig-like domain-containing protein [Opitutus terrae]ACB76346.1 hypothetical protein Oter_3066 [Opitutus terrae PB90-1]